MTGCSGELISMDIQQKSIKMSCLIEDRDRILFEKIINDPEQVLYELFPPKRLRVLRKRDHAFILPKVKTERYKR